MRSSFSLGLALPFALFAACGGSDATSGGGDAGAGDATAGSDGSSGDAGSTDGAAVDAPPPPPAIGDPCRGTPLPSDAFYTAPGLCARVVGRTTALRQITFAPNGDLFGVANSTIRLFHDANANGVFESTEITTYASTGGNGNNVHVDAAGGFIYAGTPQGVRRWPYAPGMTTGGNGEDVVVGQPADGNHPLHTTHVYDGYLYVHSGSSGNASNPMAPAYDTGRSLLRRFPLASFTPGTPFAWASGEVVTVGLRNMVGFTKNAAGRMYGVVNGLDDIHYGGADVHNDNPGEQVLALGMGKQYGYPFCFTAQRILANGNVVPPGTQLANEDFGGHDDAWCAANSSQPATFLQAHSAPLDIFFFDVQPTGALPERWRGGAFVSSHGSWDRGPATGSKVVWIPFDANGNAPMPTSTMTTTTFPYETVFGGGNAMAPQDGPWSWSASGLGESPRPVGVAVSPVDGALYISSDAGGYLYRVGIMK